MRTINWLKLLPFLLIVMGIIFLQPKEVSAQTCSAAHYECGEQIRLGTQTFCLGGTANRDIECTYSGGQCTDPSLQDPCHELTGPNSEPLCTKTVTGCQLITNPTPGPTNPPPSGDCGSGSAGQCAGNPPGTSCGNNGTCVLLGNGNCSCQGGNLPGECNGGGTIRCSVPGGSCNYYRDNPAQYCGKDNDYDPPLDKYWMCCGCTATYPAKPALVSPANNSTVPTGSVLLDWNSVSFGTGCPENTNKYQVYLDQNATPTTLKKDNLAASETSWSVSGLTAGTKYYWFIRASNGTRSTDSNIWSFTSGQPSCTVDLTPNPTSISEGATRTFTATVVPSNGTIDDVRFSSSNTSIATVSPATDGSSPYTTTATGVTDGSATITARVYMGGVQKCSDTATLTVTDPNPWWQVVDADVLTFGNLISLIPSASGEEFILPGAGGFPGIGIYGGTIADFSSGTGTGTVSSTGWLAKTSPVSQKTFNYDYFEGIIPADITFNEITSSAIAGNALSVGGVSSRGYYWYRFDGTKGSTQNQDLTITSNVNLGGRKVVLLVKGANLNIEGRITVTDGSGTFVTMVGKNASGGKGDISIDAAVGAGAGPDLEGMYFADSQFKTGAGATQLNVRGAVAAYDGLVLERDLADNSVTPAEVFEYALDQVLLYPSSLSVRKIRWKEVAP